MKSRIILEDGVLSLELNPETNHEAKVIEMFREKQIKVTKRYNSVDSTIGGYNNGKNLNLTVIEMSQEDIENRMAFEEYVTNGCPECARLDIPLDIPHDKIE